MHRQGEGVRYWQDILYDVRATHLLTRIVARWCQWERGSAFLLVGMRIGGGRELSPKDRNIPEELATDKKGTQGLHGVARQV